MNRMPIESYLYRSSILGLDDNKKLNIRDYNKLMNFHIRSSLPNFAFNNNAHSINSCNKITHFARYNNFLVSHMFGSYPYYSTWLVLMCRVLDECKKPKSSFHGYYVDNKEKIEQYLWLCDNMLFSKFNTMGVQSLYKLSKNKNFYKFLSSIDTEFIDHDVIQSLTTIFDEFSLDDSKQPLLYILKSNNIHILFNTTVYNLNDDDQEMYNQISDHESLFDYDTTTLRKIFNNKRYEFITEKPDFLFHNNGQKISDEAARKIFIVALQTNDYRNIFKRSNPNDKDFFIEFYDLIQLINPRKKLDARLAKKCFSYVQYIDVETYQYYEKVKQYFKKNGVTCRGNYSIKSNKRTNKSNDEILPYCTKLQFSFSKNDDSYEKLKQILNYIVGKNNNSNDSTFKIVLSNYITKGKHGLTASHYSFYQTTVPIRNNHIYIIVNNLVQNVCTNNAYSLEQWFETITDVNDLDKMGFDEWIKRIHLDIYFNNIKPMNVFKLFNVPIQSININFREAKEIYENLNLDDINTVGEK